jgi:transcriptional regulator with XRE-family HTH domain
LYDRVCEINTIQQKQFNFVFTGSSCVIRFESGIPQNKSIGGIKMSANRILIGSRVKEFRKRARFTQENLAEYTNLTVQHIGNIETGRKCASLDTIIEIADALGATVDLLLLGNYDSVTAVHVCEFAELIIGLDMDEQDAILDAAIDMAKALQYRE